jgi:hypothetical protein
LVIARDTSALPLNLLIAQSDGTLVSISPRGQVVWRERQHDARAVFVSRTGRTEIVTEPRAGIVVLRRIDSGDVAAVYGHSPGLSLRDPGTAVENSVGAVVIADTGDCRLVFVPQHSHRPSNLVHWTGGRGCPQAVLSAGRALVVTLARPAGIAVLAPGGASLAYVLLHEIAAPSDANAFGSDGLVFADRTQPGQVVEVNRHSGAVIWAYGPHSGPGALDEPTLASVLPDGDVLVVDAGNDRVIVIDRRTKRIVWQYGHSGVAASRPGYLDRPSTATLVPLGGI